MWKKWRNWSAEDLAQLGHVLAALQIRLAGDDRDHPQVARVVRLGQGLDRLVELLVGLGVGRDEGHVPELARIRDRLPECDQAFQVALLVDEPAKLAPSAVSCQLVPGSLHLGRPDTDTLDQVGQFFKALLGIGEGERALSPVHGDDAADAPEGDGYADGQDHRAVQPVEVEAQDEDAQDLRPSQGERDQRQDQEPGDETGDQFQGSSREPAPRRLRRFLRDEDGRGGIPRGRLTHSCRSA